MFPLWNHTYLYQCLINWWYSSNLWCQPLNSPSQHLFSIEKLMKDWWSSLSAHKELLCCHTQDSQLPFTWLQRAAPNKFTTQLWVQRGRGMNANPLRSRKYAAYHLYSWTLVWTTNSACCLPHAAIKGLFDSSFLSHHLCFAHTLHSNIMSSPPSQQAKTRPASHV